MAQAVQEHHLNDPVTRHVHQKFIRLHAGQTVGQALHHIRQTGQEGWIVYFYVVDDENRLVGIIPARRLLLNPPEARIDDLMDRKVIRLPASATLLEACEFFVLHRLLALPVVDDYGRMVGIIDVKLYTDEITDLARREEYEDVFQLIGVRLAEVRSAGVPRAFAGRFPWLLCNIAGGLVCAVIAAAFQDVLDRRIVLALFIPVVLALAESVSIQSLTLAIQLHETGQFGFRRLQQRFTREALVGLALGLAAGGLVAAVASLWQGAPRVGAVLLGGIALSVTTAALLGQAVPAAVRILRRDPKVAAGPIALALTDTATLIYYLGLAFWLL